MARHVEVDVTIRVSAFPCSTTVQPKTWKDVRYRSIMKQCSRFERFRGKQNCSALPIRVHYWFSVETALKGAQIENLPLSP